jgi:hypothetical protein
MGHITIKGINNEVFACPDKLAKCAICGKKEDLLALMNSKKVKKLKVDEVRIVCRKCYFKKLADVSKEE